jgi:serine/threonine protein kinase
LYINVIDNKEYALKIIDLQFLTKKEKEEAQNEIQFLKVLKGPTIIKFHEAFVIQNKIHIVMEYASEGNLAHAVEAKKMENMKDPTKGFTTKQILRYLG